MSVHRACIQCDNVYTGPIACPQCDGFGEPLKNTDIEWIKRELLARNEEAKLVPGFYRALIGYAQLPTRVVALYCRRKLLNTLLAKGVPHDMSAAMLTAADDRSDPNAPIIVDLNETENEQLGLE